MLKKHSLAHAAAVLPLAIGLAMNGVGDRSHATDASTSSSPAACADTGHSSTEYQRLLILPQWYLASLKEQLA